MLVKEDKGSDEGNKVKRAKCNSKEVRNSYAKRIMEGTLYWVKNDLKMLLMAQRARAAYAESVKRRLASLDWVAGTVEEQFVETSAEATRVLIYRPKEKANDKLPVFVDIHGGGFIQGSAEDDDEWCMNIVDAVGCVVVNIDYHLAPEYPFPLALEECYDVLKWIWTQAGRMGFDPMRIAVGGHSAGGNISAALCLLARDRREFSLVYQVLNYPPLDFTLDPFAKSLEDTLLTPKAQAFFSSCYFKGGEENNPLGSPLLAENLTGVPAALIISAEYDPLCAEDELYAKRLSDAGIEVTYKMFAKCMHAFTHFGPEPAATAAWDLIHRKLREVFGNRR